MSQEKPETAPSSPKPPSPKPSRPRRRWLRTVLLVVGPLLVIAGGAYVYFTTGRYIGTENAYVKADKLMVAAEVSGPIDEVAVRENQHVGKGDVLFRIEDRQYRIALSRADAELAGVRDEIASLKAAYRQKEAELALARTDATYAKKEFGRQQSLVESRNTPRAKFDAARRDRDTARQRLAVIQQEMAQLRAQLAGDPDIAVERHPRFMAARAARDRAALDLEHTVVRAPFAGIAGNTPQIGEQVTGNGALSKPVMSLVADSGAWIEANYKETELTHVLPGQAVTIRVDTYPDQEWHGTVQSIAQATGAEFSVIPPQNATGNWVKVVQRIPVRIAIANGGDGPQLRAGMSTEVEIDTGHTHPLPGFVRTALDWFDASTVRPAQAEEHR